METGKKGEKNLKFLMLSCFAKDFLVNEETNIALLSVKFWILRFKA